MTEGARRKSGAIVVLLKFTLISTLALTLWWQVQPAYVRLAGQVAGILLKYVAGFSVTAMTVTVDPSGVLNSKTSLTYTYDGRPIVINVAYLVVNLPAYVALVLATGGLTWPIRGRALGVGAAVLFAAHVVFLVVMFAVSRAENAGRDVPTVFGLLVMTMPFSLWIGLVYWKQMEDWLRGSTPSQERR